MFYDIDIDFVRKNLLKRPVDAHKGTMGHALLIAGQKGMAGAALLAARACLRSGVGKLTVRTQEDNRLILQLGIPEAILDIHQHDDSALNTCLYNAIAAGPGIGKGISQQKLLSNLFESYNRPMALDADAINTVAEYPQLKSILPENTILTPHKLELKRLLGQNSENEDEVLNMVVSFSNAHHVVVVMKGPHSKVVTPDGRIFVNSTGNPGMATAGSGDVLTGIILGLLARGYQPVQAAAIGVYIHGLAGDIAAEELGFESMIASDIINFLPKAFKRIQE